MNYKELAGDTKETVDFCIELAERELAKLDLKDCPPEFYFVVLFKDDKKFGTCIFADQLELARFMDAYHTLGEKGKWGNAIFHIENEEAQEGQSQCPEQNMK
jgi:hypothetical protein